MAKAFLVVRAIVADAGKRAAFDDWYRREHLPQAMQAFGAEKGWRFWSETDPAAHQATYQFADRAAAEAALNSAGMKALVAEFDRAWPGIPRTREVLTLVEEIGSPVRD
jgi:quinol monooxygenase YgiN